MLNVLDEFTRENLAIRVRRKLSSTDVIDVLTDLFILRGIPAYVRSDNGPEFVAGAVRRWIAAVGARTAFIEPGSPWENGYIESFNARLRDQLLNGEIFWKPRFSSKPGGAIATPYATPTQQPGIPAAGPGDDRHAKLAARRSAAEPGGQLGGDIVNALILKPDQSTGPGQTPVTKNAIAALALAACIGLLAGCGSSGQSASSGNTGPDPVPEPPPGVTPDPSPPPPNWEPTPANIRAGFPLMKPPTVSPEDAPAKMRAIFDRADAALLNDGLLFEPVPTTAEPLLRFQAACQGMDCWLDHPVIEFDEVILDELPEGARFVPIGEEDGIVVFNMDTADSSASGWGAWASHSMFVAGWAPADIGMGYGSTTSTFSAGQASGSNPDAVFASWWGYVAGVDVGTADTRGNAILGRARIMFDNRPPWPPSPSVDVKFFQMRDLATGATRAEMHWPEIPLSGGAFAQGEDGDSIQGRFYGPRHGEVGGVFERNDISGAFGATQGVTTAR